MTISRTIFQGFGGYVGRVDGDTKCSIWTENPSDIQFDPDRMIAIDLAKTPSAAGAGHVPWSQVQIDDERAMLTGGLSHIGTGYEDLRWTGAVYLAKPYLDGLDPAVRPPALPADYALHAREYEFQAVLYGTSATDPRAGRRYYGFHARVDSLIGSMAHVTIWNGGRSKDAVDPFDPRSVPKTATIDLDDATKCDRSLSVGGLTQIDAMTLEGALFVERSVAQSLYLEIPKLPRGLGQAPASRRRLYLVA